MGRVIFIEGNVEGREGRVLIQRVRLRGDV